MSGIQSISVNAAQTYASVGAQNQQSLAPFSNLDLSEAQRAKLRSIFTSAKQDGTPRSAVRQEIDAVLTPAQQQTLQADFKTGVGHRPPPTSADATSSQASSTSTAASTPATTAASSEESLVDAVLNVKNQATAAQSTLIDTLQHSVLATNPAVTSTAQ
jgi:hypothetical protein